MLSLPLASGGRPTFIALLMALMTAVFALPVGSSQGATAEMRAAPPHALPWKFSKFAPE
jgi:hypothetical protein